MKPYLFLYNIAACFGWAYVLYLSVQAYLANKTAHELWNIVQGPLKIVQTAALLEVFHSLFGLVRSPVFSTLVQVGSRLSILWIYMNASAASHDHWSLWLVVFSWSLVEVPRYLFYALNLYTEKVPFVLFFLRYNLFAVLYPSGITGEIFQILKAMPALKVECLSCWYLSLFLLALYVPGSPFMYFHMMGQRKSANMRRNAAKPGSPPPVAGIEFPEDKKGERSTTAINQGAFVASLAAIDKKAAEEAKKVRNWRFGYTRHVVRNVELSAQSPEACLNAAEAGLEYLHNNFEFIRDGQTYKLAEAMKKFTGSFHTAVIEGTKPKPAKFDYEVPYKDKNLKGKELLAQLKKWAEYGTIEPEAQAAIAAVVNNPEWLDLSDLYFVLLGAGSAMGPLLVLMALGANVIAVDLDRAPIWERLIGIAKNSPGRMIFPTKAPADGLDDKQLAAVAGCNLFTQTPEIKNWLLKVEPGKPLIIGGYAYLDGALFIKVAMAMDGIIKGVLDSRPNTALAFLCSPTDVFVVSDRARDAMVKNHKSAPLWQKMVSLLSGGKFLVPNARRPVEAKDKKNKFNVVDGLVVAQGPNYALAKRLQHWRCMLAWSKGSIVSTNIAPSTATRSVVHNKQFAAAYGGMHHFKPMEVMYQETSNAVMGALLIHDMRNPKSFAHPDTPLASPLQLFAGGAFHGGVWRMGYKMNSIGEMAAVAYYLKSYRAYLAGAMAAITGVVAYIVTHGPPHKW